jgi:hypothetical protein
MEHEIWTVTEYAQELEMEVLDLVGPSAHEMARSILGWMPMTDEDEQDPRYEPYWMAVSAATQSILSAIASRMINWQVEQP